MSDYGQAQLEQRIRHALRERAAGYRTMAMPGVVPIDRFASARASRRWRSMVLGAAVVATVTVLIVSWVVVARPGSDSATRSPRPESTLSSPVGVGEEVPLEQVRTPEAIEGSLEIAQLVPGTIPLTLKAGEGPSVTITNQLSLPDNTPSSCLAIERRTTVAVSGASSECLPTAVLQVFYYPRPETSTQATVYYAWVEVPDGAAYVTFESTLLRAWQRPIEGNVVFPVDGGPIGGTARAFGSEGQPLGDVEIQASYNGAQYLPGMPPTSEPEAYSVPSDLTLAEECEVVPLSALGPGDEPTLLVHDGGTGVPAEFDKREYCRQVATLHPDPAGDIVASFYVMNGEVTADYFEAVRTVAGGGESVTNGAPIPFDEAQRRIAAQHAQRDF